MPDMTINLLVLAVVVGLLLFSMLSSPRYKKWYTQKKADRTRKLAHAGKLTCEDAECKDIAVVLTPNGYFCDWHWEPMSKRALPNGGYVTWSHALYHAVRRS